MEASAMFYGPLIMLEEMVVLEVEVVVGIPIHLTLEHILQMEFLILVEEVEELVIMMMITGQ